MIRILIIPLPLYNELVQILALSDNTAMHSAMKPRLYCLDETRLVSKIIKMQPKVQLVPSQQNHH